MTKFIKSLRGGQITIPIEFRQKLGISPESLLQVSVTEGELRIKPAKTTTESQGSPWLKEVYDAFADVREHMKQYSEEEINEAIDAAVRAVRKSHAKGSI